MTARHSTYRLHEAMPQTANGLGGFLHHVRGHDHREVALRFYNEQHLASLGGTLAAAVSRHGPEIALTYIDMKNHGVYE